MNDELKQFYVTQDSERIVYNAFIISSPTIGEFRFVIDQSDNLDFYVDSATKEFTGCVASIPEQSILSSDDVDKGEVAFDRVGFEVVSEMRKLDDAPTFEAVTVRFLTYLEGEQDALYDYSAYMSNFTAGARQVKLALTTENLEKQTKVNKIYDPSIYVGLQGL